MPESVKKRIEIVPSSLPSLAFAVYHMFVLLVSHLYIVNLLSLS